MALKTATQNKPVEAIRRWPFDYSTDEIKNSVGDFETIYATHCTGARIHNEILGHIFQGIEDWCAEEKAITQKNGQWFIQYYLFNNWWRPKYDGMRELQSRRGYAKRMELRQLDEKKEEVVSAVSMREKSADDLEWELKNGIKIEEIPF
jgi:hypothetical protein